MGRLTDTVTERLETHRRRRQNLPDWFPFFAVVVGALAAVVLGAQAIFGGDGTSPTDTAPRMYVPSPANTAPTTVAPAGTNTTSTTSGDRGSPAATPSGGEVPVRTREGGTLEVPADAVEVARRAALAMVTGDDADVPVAGAAPPLTPLPGATSPSVEEVVVLTSSKGSYEFTVAVAPSPEAAAVQRIVTVSESAGRWVWVP